VSVGFAYGTLGLPTPRKVPVTAVVGQPIPVGEQMSPEEPQFNERVEELHAVFSTAIRQLYESYRGQYSDGVHEWSTRPLVVI
jgi:N-formylglutamate amidohydrolase